MATIVCHGLPSALDSHLVESRIHNLRLTSPKPLTNQPIDLPFKTCFLESNTKSNEDSWSSIQSLSKSNASNGLKESTYVHPNVKLPWQKLSSKSLELCTENLGNETGADILESSIDFFSLTSSSCDKLDTEEQKKNSCKNLRADKKERAKNFPPPLKSMRGLESLRVKPHRENGRLVMELTKVPSNVSCFQAERSNGRLRLSFWNEVDEDDTDDEDEEEENTNEVEECIIDNENEVKDVEECIIDNEHEVKEVEEFIIDNENEANAIEECIIDNENEANAIEECIIDNENEEIYEIQTPTHRHKILRMEKYERESRRRCKEIGKHENHEKMASWSEPLWLTLVIS
ncbi:hypothetical protein RYX36_005239 [Vicia faba]